MKIYVDPRFLDPEMCGRIRRAMDRGAAEPAEVLQQEIALDREVRRALSIEVDARTTADVEARLESARDAIAAFYSLSLGRREGPGFLRYEAGGFYRPHRDRGASRSWPAARRRQISVVVFLNSSHEAAAAGGFSGGWLRLFDTGSTPIDIVPAEGSLVAFPATTLHEVAPVRAGTRDTIIDWFY